jgi:hypothetical protein
MASRLTKIDNGAAELVSGEQVCPGMIASLSHQARAQMRD